jgi:NitT/TauT family transport system substrate-binding protein
VFSIKRRQLALLAAAAAVPEWLSACSAPPPLRIAGHPWPGYEPFFFAHAQGWLPNNMVLLDLPTIKASIDAMKEGRADGAMLTLDEALALQVRGMSLEVVLIFDISKGADMLVARPQLKHLAQLRGTRIGLEPSTLGELMLSMVLEKAGLNRADVKLQRIPYEEQEAAWATGGLDALITYEPVAGRLTGKSAHALLTTKELPDSIFDVLVVKSESARAHSETLRNMLRAHFKALEQYHRNPWDTAYRMAPRLKISAEELIDSFRGLELPDLVANRSALNRDNSHLLQVTKRLSAIMVDAGTLPGPANPDRLFNDAYLPGDAT